MAQHQLPKAQRDEIVRLVKENSHRNPTRFMVAHWLMQSTGIKKKTALEYVNLALRDCHVVKQGFTICVPGQRGK